MEIQRAKKSYDILEEQSEKTCATAYQDLL